MGLKQSMELPAFGVIVAAIDEQGGFMVILNLYFESISAQIFCKDGQEPHGECTSDGKCPENEPVGWQCVKVRDSTALQCCPTINEGSAGDALPSFRELKRGHKKDFGAASSSEGSDDSSASDTDADRGDRDQSDDVDDSDNDDNSQSDEKSAADASKYSSEEPSSDSSEEKQNVPWCKDQQVECAFHANMCIIDGTFEQMQQICPKTCNRCAGEIIDVADDCYQHVAKCRNPEDIQLLSWQCPKTCGWTLMNRPTPGRTFNSPALFQDTRIPISVYSNLAICAGLTDNANCIEWNKNFFCSSPYYTEAHKKQSCPVMCRLCGVNV
uniref:ShKT domain-containing protein n=1 Tax=Ditylenchus dipsaci TaxID=166011 RepID=A0A915CZ47_9BILA